MAKRDADNVPKVEIAELSRKGFLSGKESGAILWWGLNERIFCFHISNVFIDRPEPDNDTEGWSDPRKEAQEGMVEFKAVTEVFMDKGGMRETDEPPIWQTAALVTTPCNYGKSRFWFSCPGLKGKPCRKRVGTLYWLDKRIACRTCHHLAYKVQRVKKSERGHGRIRPIDKVEEAWESVTKTFYRGKPTKRFLRARKMQAEQNAAFEAAGVNIRNFSS